jgi:hypothetical protein
VLKRERLTERQESVSLPHVRSEPTWENGAWHSGSRGFADTEEDGGSTPPAPTTPSLTSANTVYEGSLTGTQGTDPIKWARTAVESTLLVNQLCSLELGTCLSRRSSPALAKTSRRAPPGAECQEPSPHDDVQAWGRLSAFASSRKISTTRWRWTGFAVSPLRSTWAMRGTVFPPLGGRPGQGLEPQAQDSPWKLWLVTAGSWTPTWDLKLKRFGSTSPIWRSRCGRSPSGCTPPLACC